jgi:hypothetical protein
MLNRRNATGLFSFAFVMAGLAAGCMDASEPPPSDDRLGTARAEIGGCQPAPSYVYGEGWRLESEAAACDLAQRNADEACRWASGQDCCSKADCFCGGGPGTPESGDYYACVVYVELY